MITHVVLDLETFATSPVAAIASLGAVAFTGGRPPSMDEVFNAADDMVNLAVRLAKPAFYCNVNKSEGEINMDTVRWWLGRDGDRSPSEAARAALVTGGSRAEGMMLQVFDAWLTNQCDNKDDLRVWSHATFDPPVTESGYRRASGLDGHWPYRAMSDLRTAYRQAKMNGHEELTTEPLILHHALHDAYREALALQHAISIVPTLGN